MSEPIEGRASVDENGALMIRLGGGSGPLVDMAAVWAPLKGQRVRVMSTANSRQGWVLIEYDMEVRK